MGLDIHIAKAKLTNHGFTLTELMFATAITGALALGVSTVAKNTIEFYEAEERRQDAADKANRWTRYFKNRTDRQKNLTFTSQCNSKNPNVVQPQSCMTIKSASGQALLHLRNLCKKSTHKKLPHRQLVAFYQKKWDNCFMKCPKGSIPYFRISDPVRKKIYTFPGKTPKTIGASLCFEKFGNIPYTKARISIAIISNINNGLNKSSSEIFLGGEESSNEIDWID